MVLNQDLKIKLCRVLSELPLTATEINSVLSFISNDLLFRFPEIEQENRDAERNENNLAA